ncbi:MAG: flagellar biosynthetic protein FliR [Peptococcaceae bacterium]|nr:flagellar biosynthetic protein FliR [Peptococcaceae bacterium]MDH7524052.1 flagellar biosynthetic protein FliR [Peptococcaceae bacterium]
MLQESDKFFILLARLGGIAFAPVYSTKNLPVTWKAAFILFMALTAWQLGAGENFDVPGSTAAYLLVVASEVVTGLALSLVAQLFFAAVQLAGEVIDVQMGFGIMNVIDPLSGTQAPILGNLKFILALLVFLQVNGHHLFIQALFDSYSLVPVGRLSIQKDFAALLTTYFGGVFATGFKLALPVAAALFFTDLIMGIMSRTIPQMNIFLVGMPAKILLGFGVLLAAIPFYIYLMNTLIAEMVKQLYHILDVMV